MYIYLLFNKKKKTVEKSIQMKKKISVSNFINDSPNKLIILHGYVKCKNYVYLKSKYAEEKSEWRHKKYDNLK